MRLPRHISATKAFVAIAIALGVTLVLLIAYAVWTSSPQSFRAVGGRTRAGIKPLITISGPGRGEKPKLSRPLSAAFGKYGRIYVSDTGNNRIVVFDREGRYLFSWGGHGVAKPLPGVKNTWEPGMLNFPSGIAIDDEGRVYVADFRNDQIQVFDADGNYLRRFPDPAKPVGKGSSGQDGTGIAVTDVAVRDGKVYATDTYQVFVFTTGGRLVTQFGRPGDGRGDLDHPNGIATAKGRIYVSDSNHNRVTAFDPDGKVLWSAGELVSELATRVVSDFNLPRGIDVMRDGNLIVADALEQSLVVLGDDGRVVARYGMRGSEPGQVNFPNDVDVGSGRQVLVADKANNRVQVVELTRR